jgi:ComEC/Rec2-related protein
MNNPLPLVALLYATGLVLGLYLPIPLVPLFFLCFATGTAALLCSRCRTVLLFVLLPLLGWTNYLSQTALLSPIDLRRLIGAEPAYVTVRGVLAAAPVVREHIRRRRLLQRSVLELELNALRREHASTWEPAFGRVTATTPGLLEPMFFAGQHLEVTGVLAPPKGPSAPGQFDYRAYLRFQGIHYQLHSESTNDWRVVRATGARPVGPPLCDRFCQWAQGVLARGLPEEDESLRLLWAMVLGWKTALTQEVAEPFMQSGTLHIFAISGLHIALIAGILVSLLRVLRVPRSGSGLIVIPLIWFYTAATGWQASAIRSTVMMSVIIVGWALKRPSDLINSLAAAGLIILIWDPTQLFQASFQLSFFVVLGIALLAPPFERLKRRLLKPDPLIPPELRPAWKRWLDAPLRWFLTSLGTSLAAWLGSMPLIAYYFYMVTPGSLLANLVIVPLSSFALMSSLGAVVCGGWCPSVSELFNHSSWFWMFLMIQLSKWFASLPGAYLYVEQPSWMAFSTYYLLLAVGLSGVLLKARHRSWAIAAAGLAAAVWPSARLLAARTVQLTVLPIRGGVTYVNAPGIANDLLLDCGDARMAESLVKPYLRSQGVNRLPVLALTQGDVQHAGGTELVLTHFRPREVTTSPARFRSPAYRALVALLDKAPQRWRRVERGQRIGFWKVLHPATDDRFAQGNNSALVLQAEVRRSRVLLLSGLGRLGQRALLDREHDLRADILIMAAPSRVEDLINPALLEAIHPQLIILAGADFPAAARPNREIRARLDDLHVPVIYTCDVGATVLSIKAAGWRVQTMDPEHLFTGKAL